MEDKELEFVTKNIRSELNERSKETTLHLTKTLQEFNKGSKQDVYIVESAKQMAIREQILQSTFDLLHQIEVISNQDLETSISLIDKKTIQIEICNQYLQQLLHQCQPLKQKSEQWEQQHPSPISSPLKI